MDTHKNNNYIENDEFYYEIEKFKETSIISRKLGQMFVDLAEHNTHSSFFRRYSKEDLEDMKIDANIACLKALNKYDMSKDNPFSYFTSIVINAFRYYLKMKYANINFKLDLIEETYAKANKPFNNQIKQDIIDAKKRKNKKHQEVT